jgi:putative endonuclease
MGVIVQMSRLWYVYICDRGGQLYTGITTNLAHRMIQHRARLLYQESFKDKGSAAKREREIKGWRQEKKLALIEGGRHVSSP